jgi:universal stress protein A
MAYRRILQIVDLTDASLVIGQRVKALAQAFAAEVELLHVVELIPTESLGDTLLPTAQIEREVTEQAKQRLRTIAAQLGVPESACRIATGNVKTEIVRVARERQVDLIVLGARERHGPSILVNLTEDTVLHAAHCDVLAMRTGAGS